MRFSAVFLAFAVCIRSAVCAVPVVDMTPDEAAALVSAQVALAEGYSRTKRCMTGVSNKVGCVRAFYEDMKSTKPHRSAQALVELVFSTELKHDLKNGGAAFMSRLMNGQVRKPDLVSDALDNLVNWSERTGVAKIQCIDPRSTAAVCRPVPAKSDVGAIQASIRDPVYIPNPAPARVEIDLAERSMTTTVMSQSLGEVVAQTNAAIQGLSENCDRMGLTCVSSQFSDQPWSNEAKAAAILFVKTAMERANLVNLVYQVVHARFTDEIRAAAQTRVGIAPLIRNLHDAHLCSVLAVGDC